MRRLPSAISAARETPCGFLPALFRNNKAVIQTEFCTKTLHSSYTAKFSASRANRINYFWKLSHPLRMTEFESGRGETNESKAIQQQRQKQIPGGNDRKKGNGKSRGKGKGKCRDPSPSLRSRVRMTA